MRTVVPDDLDGARADRTVAALFDVSRSVARRTIDAGGATRGGAPLRPSDAVAAGDELAVTIVEVEQKVEAEDVEFAVAYEDDHVIVVDKPSGLVVHPGAGTSSGTLANGLLGRFAWAGELGSERRWGIVHRLDRGTSGLLIVAKTAEAHERLAGCSTGTRAVTRRYLALASGRVRQRHRHRRRSDRKGPFQPHQDGGYRWWPLCPQPLPAAGHLGRAQRRPCCPLSWRRGAPIRSGCIMQAIDRPISGDPVYGPARRRVTGDPGRTWLHATELVFEHPSGAGEVTVAIRTPRRPGGLAASAWPPDQWFDPRRGRS